MTGEHERPTALLIGTTFFGYEKDIVAELARQGFSTTFVDERPTNSATGRAVMRVRRTLVGRSIAKYYRGWQRQLSSENFDLVFVIKGEIVPRWFLEWLRVKNPNARFVIYLWDAISNNVNCLELLDIFDQRLSFDLDDVSRRGDLDHLPLFYTQNFSPSLETDTPRQYSMSFVGTLHTARFAFVRRLFDGRQRTLSYFFVQARWYFAILKYITRQHPGVSWSDVAFTSMSRDETAAIFRSSHAVVDMPRRGQVGSTMRTFEALASGAMLVTTNASVTRERFYDSSRIVVVREDAPDDELEAAWSHLWSDPPPNGAPEGFDEYSLTSWVHTIVTRRVESARSSVGDAV